MSNKIKGDQIRDNSIQPAKLDSTYESGLLLKDGSRALTGDLDAGGQKLTNLGNPVNPSDAVPLSYVTGLNKAQKEIVKAASTVNLTLSGAQTVDGISLVAADRCLVKDQTDPIENGIYVVSAGAWARASDADSALELNGALVVVAQGTVNADRLYLQTSESPAPGTDAIQWTQVGSQAAGAYATSSNKGMTGSVTTAVGDAITAIAVASTPAGDSYVEVAINGVLYRVGNGVNTADVYFSADGGTTPRAIANISAGDTCHKGSALGFNTDALDIVDFYFEV